MRAARFLEHCPSLESPPHLTRARRSPRQPGAIAAASLALALSLIGLAACGTSGSEQRTSGGIGKVPPQALDPSDVSESVPDLPGVGARCQPGGMCLCRDVDAAGRGTSPDGPGGDAEAAPPPEGYKRFELRTGRGDDTMRITIEGVGTFVKSGATPDARCIYVDLPPGAHRVRYHVTAVNKSQGAEPRLRVSEYSPRFKRWYRTFAFKCTDGEQPCTKELAHDMFDVLLKTADGKFDPCGSTKVQGLRFWTDKEPDVSVGDFNLQIVLNVYKFATRFPPDAPRCKGFGGKAPASFGAGDDGDMSVSPGGPTPAPAPAKE